MDEPKATIVYEPAALDNPRFTGRLESVDDLTALASDTLRLNLTAPQMTRVLRDAATGGAPPTSSRAKRIARLFDEPLVQRMIETVLAPFRDSAPKIAEWVAKRALAVVELTTRDEILDTYARIRPTAALLAKHGSRAITATIDAVGHVVIKTANLIRRVLHIASPFVSLVAGYTLKILVPVAIGGAAVASPLLLLSDPAFKTDIRPLTRDEARALADEIFRNEVYFWRYMHEAPGALHAGMLARDGRGVRGARAPLSDGHSLDLATYLAALQLSVQQLNERVADLETRAHHIPHISVRISAGATNEF